MGNFWLNIVRLGKKSLDEQLRLVPEMSPIVHFSDLILKIMPAGKVTSK